MIPLKHRTVRLCGVSEKGENYEKDIYIYDSTNAVRCFVQRG